MNQKVEARIRPRSDTLLEPRHGCGFPKPPRQATDSSLHLQLLCHYHRHRLSTTRTSKRTKNKRKNSKKIKKTKKKMAMVARALFYFFSMVVFVDDGISMMMMTQ